MQKMRVNFDFCTVLLKIVTFTATLLQMINGINVCFIVGYFLASLFQFKAK